MRTVRGWAPPLLGPLPDDFLRLAPSPWGVTQKKQVGITVNGVLDATRMKFGFLNIRVKFLVSCLSLHHQYKSTLLLKMLKIETQYNLCIT